MEAVPEEQRSSNLVYRERTGRGHEALPDTEFHCDVPGAISSLRLDLIPPPKWEESLSTVCCLELRELKVGLPSTFNSIPFHIFMIKPDTGFPQLP